MKKRYLPGQKVKDRDAVRLAYRAKAKMNRHIGDKEVYIQKMLQSAKDYVSNGLIEEAKPLTQNIAKAEEDKKRLLRRRLAYDRIIAVAEGGANTEDMGDTDKLLARWASQKNNRDRYGDRFGDVLDGLNERETGIREADDELDQIQGEHGQYSDRAETILKELVVEVNTRKQQARKMLEEAQEEGEQMPV